MLGFLVMSLAAVGYGAAASYNCTKVNGVEGVCDLMLNQLTLAGGRCSGCGAFGAMYFWSGIKAPACNYNTQDKSITEQLKIGMRYFDFDLGYIHKSEESLPYWEEGPVIVSIGGGAVAYSRSLKKALTEIRDFMNANKDEIVIMRINKYYQEKKETRDLLLKSIKPTFDSVFGPEGSEGVQLNFYTTLKPVRYMIESNERLVLYLNKDFWGSTLSDFRAHPDNFFESEDNYYGYNTCQNQEAIAKSILQHEGVNKRNIPTLANWVLGRGLPCYSNGGKLCMSEIQHVEEIWDKVVAGTHLRRPLNVVVADYVEARFAEVIAKINKKALEYYTKRPW